MKILDLFSMCKYKEYNGATTVSLPIVKNYHLNTVVASSIPEVLHLKLPVVSQNVRVRKTWSLVCIF